MHLPPFQGPQLAGPARADAPVVLAGRRALATGWAAAGLEEVWLHPLRALRRLRLVGAAPAHAARSTPASFERRLRLGDREVVERAFVPATAATVALEWEVLPSRGLGGAAPGPIDLEIEWLSDFGGAAPPDPPGAGPEADRLLLLRDGPADSGAALVFEGNRPLGARVEPAPAGWRQRSAGLRCHLHVRLEPGEHFLLTIGAATDGRALADARTPPAHLPALVSARAADDQRRVDEQLTISATDPFARQAFRWATLRLPGFLAELPDRPAATVVAGYGPGVRPRASAAATLRVGLAALAAGDARLALDAARSALAGTGGEPAAMVPARESGSPAAAPTVLPGDAAVTAILLFARHFLTTGEPAELHGAWARLLAAADRLADTSRPGRGGDPALAAAALEQLALAAESSGRNPEAARLRQIAGGLAAPATATQALARAGGWAAWSAGLAEPAYQRWQAFARAGLGSACALWAGPAGVDDAAATAAVVSGVTYGILGLDADAPRARLRLRPQIPRAWDRFDVTGLRVGDAELTLSYVGEPGLDTFRVEQVSGGVPLRLALEPAIPAAVSAARVDGVPATLTARPHGDRVLVPVQLVLDAPRTLELVWQA